MVATRRRCSSVPARCARQHANCWAGRQYLWGGPPLVHFCPLHGWRKCCRWPPFQWRWVWPACTTHNTRRGASPTLCHSLARMNTAAPRPCLCIEWYHGATQLLPAAVRWPTRTTTSPQTTRPPRRLRPCSSCLPRSPPRSPSTSSCLMVRPLPTAWSSHRARPPTLQLHAAPPPLRVQPPRHCCCCCCCCFCPAGLGFVRLDNVPTLDTCVSLRQFLAEHPSTCSFTSYRLVRHRHHDHAAATVITVEGDSALAIVTRC